MAVERVDQYTKVEQEKAYNIGSNKPSIEWPSKGEIVFNNVFMKYRQELPHVLKGLSFNIRGGSKVGVIGRTGAGKSSLFLTLLRLIEIDTERATESNILIDSIDISKIGLMDLRSRISVIPQDPTLFTGNIKFNLDPFNKYSEKDLINSLKMSEVC